MIFEFCLPVLEKFGGMMMISPSAVHSTKQSSYCWQKATNSLSVMGTRRGLKITGAIDSKSSTTNCMSPVYRHGIE
jgi:hypothetical protein